MTGLSVILVDDEPLAIETLEGLCERDPRIDVVGMAESGPAAVEMAGRLRPDAVLLDIGMPDMDGLQLAEALRSLPEPPLVVFVTAYDHHATEAFDLSVVDYVLKPIRAERFRRAIDRLAEAVDRRQWASPEGSDQLWLPRRGTVVRVPVASILRIEAERDYARVFTSEESFLLRTTMNAIEERLSPASFVRIHRSMIIALDEIAGCRHIGNGAWSVFDEDGRDFPVGRRYLESVRRVLALNP